MWSEVLHASRAFCRNEVLALMMFASDAPGGGGAL
jgi:hypothetical protein